jgi:hypothetical protein
VHEHLVRGHVDAHDAAAVQQGAVLLVDRDPPGQLVQVGGGGTRDVPLDAELPEQRRGRAERQARRASRLVRTRRRHMRAQELRRHELPRPSLDVLAVARIGAVGGPHAVEAFEDLEVDAPAAGRAALPLDARMPPAQFVDEFVERERLGVDGRGAASGDRSGVDEVAIVVPLDEGDRVLGGECVERLQQVCAHGGIAQIEHELVAHQGRNAPARREDPVGMLAV